jgi:hypothetical protein
MLLLLSSRSLCLNSFIIYVYSLLQGIYKIIVQFHKLIKNVYLTLHGHNIRRRLSVCSMFRCPDLWLQFSVSFVHSYIVLVWCAFFKPCMKLRLNCNHRSGHLKTEHTGSLLLLQRHLGNRSCGSALSKTSELLAVYEKLGQFPLLTVYIVPV